MKIFRSNRTPIGLDLAGREFKAIQLARTSTGYRIEAAVVLAQPENTPLDAARAKWIADVLARQGFKGHRVILAAPVAKLEAEMLELPPRASGAPVEQIARGEMATVARLTGGFEMACWDLPAPPRGGAGTSMLSVAFRHADADMLLDPLESAGLDVRAIDARAWALARAIATDETDSAPRLVLDLEWDTGFVALVHRQKVLYQRTLAEIGFGTLHRGVAEQFDLSGEVTEFLLTQHDELAAPTRTADPAAATSSLQKARIAGLVAQYASVITDELEQSFAFARHRYPDLAPRGLLISGAGARVIGLCEQLTNRLRTEVTPISPAMRLPCPDDLAETCLNPALATALGMALYDDVKLSSAADAQGGRR
jgi:Tfp pilus assembly PilM family ATPase